MYKKIVSFIILIHIFIGVIACGKVAEEQPQSTQKVTAATEAEAKEQENNAEETVEAIRTEETWKEKYVQYEGSSVVFTYPASWSLEILQGEDGGNVIYYGEIEKMVETIDFVVQD